MWKPIFYAGVICSAVAGLFLATEVGRAAFMSSPLEWERGNPALTAILLLLAIFPLAALFLRVASLLAVRNLFASFLVLFASSCTGFCAVFIALLELRGLRGVEVPLTEAMRAGSQALGWFLALSFLALAPYLRIHAGRLFFAAVFCPPLLFAAALLPQPAAHPAALTAFWGSIAAMFVSLSVHSLRHRHLFLEVTNLREILDGRVDPAFARRPGKLTLGNDVAFDS
jgi:hypothetical protein